MRLCETHMEKMCRMTLVTEKQPVDPKLEALYRQAAAANKAHSVKKHKFDLEIKPVQQFIFNSLCSTSLPIFEQFLNMFRSATMQGVSG